MCTYIYAGILHLGVYEQEKYAVRVPDGKAREQDWWLPTSMLDMLAKGIPSLQPLTIDCTEREANGACSVLIQPICKARTFQREAYLPSVSSSCYQLSQYLAGSPSRAINSAPPSNTTCSFIVRQMSTSRWWRFSGFHRNLATSGICNWIQISAYFSYITRLSRKPNTVTGVDTYFLDRLQHPRNPLWIF